MENSSVVLQKAKRRITQDPVILPLAIYTPKELKTGVQTKNCA